MVQRDGRYSREAEKGNGKYALYMRNRSLEIATVEALYIRYDTYIAVYGIWVIVPIRSIVSVFLSFVLCVVFVCSTLILTEQLPILPMGVRVRSNKATTKP